MDTRTACDAAMPMLTWPGAALSTRVAGEVMLASDAVTHAIS
jgi:hypothetical protein